MKQTARFLLVVFCAVLFIGLASPAAYAAGISDSMLFFFPCNEEQANLSGTYWNGIVVEDSEGNLHIIASFLSALDGIKCEAPAVLAINKSSGTYLTLEDYDSDAGVAIYKPYGELKGATPLPLAPSTSLDVGDPVTVYGMEWLSDSESYDDLFRTYDAKVADAAISEQQNYIYMVLDTAAPNPYWENAAVMDKDGHMVGVLLSSTSMTYVLPAEYLMGYLGYGEDYVVPDGIDIDDVKDATFDTSISSNGGSEAPDAIDDTDTDGKGSGTSLDNAISSGTNNGHIQTIGSSYAGIRTAVTVAVIAILVGIAVFLVVFFTKRSKSANAAAFVPVEETITTPSVPGKYFIVAKGGEHTGERFLVEDSIIIGRRADTCGIILSPATYGISGEHCRIDLIEGGLELTDLGSTFGTYFEGGRLDAEEPILLTDGDTFSLADPNDNLFVVQFVPDPVEPEIPETAETEAEDSETNEETEE